MQINQNDEHSMNGFFKALYQFCKTDAYLNLRFLPSAENLFIPLKEINTIPPIIKSHRNQNCYFGVAARQNGDGSKNGITEIPSLWCDVDVIKGSPAFDHFKQTYKDFPLKPSVLIETGGGYHLYWLLKEPASKEEIPRVEDLLKRIATHLGGDKVAAEAARILRVPGTYNLKYKPKRRVIVRHFHPEKQFNLDDFEIFAPLPAGAGRDQHRPSGWEKELLEGVADGKRNTSIARLAGRYLGKGLSGEEIIPILMDANSRFAPPLTMGEVETILESVIKTDSRNHPDRLEEVSSGPHRHHDDAPPILPTLGDIYDMDIKVEWVVDKLIPKQSVTVLHGKGGVGKTWLQLQMGSNVAEGISFVGQLPVMQTPVYYIDFENSLATLHDRAIVLGRSGLRVWHVSNPVPPPRLDSREWEQYKKLPAGVLIFDTLRASQMLDENSSRDMAMVMCRLKELRDMGFTVILIHHTPKSDERTYKGSTAIQDLCDHVLSLDRVRGVGSDQEIDEEDWSFPLRLGVRGKTRFEPFSIYLVFDPNRGFGVAPDPDEEILKTIHFLIVNFKEEHGVAPNQTSIVEMVKEHNVNRKKVQRLLRKGEGQFWRVILAPNTRAKLYDPIIEMVIAPLFSPIKGGTMGQWGMKARPATPKPTLMLPLENTSLTHGSEGMKTNGSMGQNHCSKGAGKKGTAGTMESYYEVDDDGRLTY